jgi:hypothetical protein
MMDVLAGAILAAVWIFGIAPLAFGPAYGTYMEGVVNGLYATSFSAGLLAIISACVWAVHQLSR